MRRIRGQSASEVSLVVSVIVLAVVAASSTMIPLFDSGVRDLGGDVRNMLDEGDVGGVGSGRGGGTGNAATPSRSIASDEDIANASTAESRLSPDIGPPTPPAN